MTIARIALLGLAAVPSPVLAEVMDKEPGIREFWLWAAGMSLVGFAFCRTRLWLAPLAVVLLLQLPQVHALAELSDRHVGPAMRSELGAAYDSYRSQLYVTLFMACTAPLVGALLRMREGRSRSIAR
jgi:hypothetical protein